MRRPSPDADGREEDGDECAVELDGVLDDDEAVFGVLEGGDEEADDETEDDVGSFSKSLLVLTPEKTMAIGLSQSMESTGNEVERLVAHP